MTVVVSLTHRSRIYNVDNMARQHPSHEHFVVKVDPTTDRQALESRAAAIGTLEPVPGHDDMLLLHVHDAVARARTAWDHVQDAIGREFTVMPVILDERGIPSYPTGRVGVRFKQAPEPADVERFAEQLNLRLVGMNKYVAAQAVFEPNDHTDYLPDVVDVAASDERVDKVWPEALSAYKRS